MSCEVCFEKRGKLHPDDHVRCPGCGCCKLCWCECPKPKKNYAFALFWLIYFATVIAVPSLVFGAEVPYDFQTLDINAGTGISTFPVDINSNRIVLDRTWERDTTGNPVTGGLIARPNNRKFNKFKDVQRFNCTFTDPISINDLGQATGFCKGGAFLRQSDGTITILGGPSEAVADSTFGFHISSNGRISGTFCTIEVNVGGCLYRGFTWHPTEGYRVINFIDSFGPGAHTDTIVLGTTASGIALVEYASETDVGNNQLSHGFAIYDNGNWSFPFPPDLSWRGERGVTMGDFTDNQQTIVLFFNEGKPPRLSFYDDKTFFDITGWPLNWLLVEVAGIANETLDFVGTYAIASGNPPAVNYEYHGFVATLAPAHLAKK